MEYQIHILPANKHVLAEAGSNLLEVLRSSNSCAEGTCGGKGICGKCKVRILQGEVPLTASDRAQLTQKELEQGYRLACKARVNSDISLEASEQSEDSETKKQSSTIEGLKIDTILRKEYLQLSEPDLNNQQADYERIQAALSGNGEAVEVALGVLQKIPSIMRASRFKSTCTLYGNRIIAIEKGNTTDELYGISFDIGTTTIVGTLVDMISGRPLAVSSAGNPQRSYGADVIARIAYCSQESGTETLREKVVLGMNAIIDEVCAATGVSRNSIYHVTTVGNTAMHHLFAGVDPTYLALSPYVPTFQGAQELSAAQALLQVNPEAVVYMLPGIAGYVGADTVGVILDSHIDESPCIKLVIDIGTNGEVLLGSKDRLLACSTAAGPAFEGAQIKQGMRAVEGAIEKVRMGSTCEVLTIGRKPARGICGSGLLDAVAQLLACGIVDTSGRLRSPEELPEVSRQLTERIVEGEHGLDFVLVSEEESARGKPIVITQKDIREVQLAKGAIYAGIKTMEKALAQ